MAKGLHETSNLEIIGYADRLHDGMFPSVVPPVFRLKTDHSKILLPPFSLSGGFVCNATEVGPDELASLDARGEITRLEGSPIPAAGDHDLWLNEQGKVHYEPRARVEHTLRRIGDDNLDRAQEALASGRLDDAERFAGVALNADDRRIEPLAIKVAIRRARGEHSLARSMASLAADAMTANVFEAVVKKFFDSIPKESADCGTRSPMAGMARERPMVLAAA